MTVCERFLPVARVNLDPVAAVGIDGQAWTITPLSGGEVLLTGPLAPGPAVAVVVAAADGTSTTLIVHQRECWTQGSTPEPSPAASSNPADITGTTTGEPSTTVAAGRDERPRTLAGSSALILAVLVAVALLIAIFRRVRAWSAPPRHRAAGIADGTLYPDARTSPPPIVPLATGHHPGASPTVTVPVPPPTQLDPEDPETGEYQQRLTEWLDGITPDHTD